VVQKRAVHPRGHGGVGEHRCQHRARVDPKHHRRVAGHDGVGGIGLLREHGRVADALARAEETDDGLGAVGQVAHDLDQPRLDQGEVRCRVARLPEPLAAREGAHVSALREVGEQCVVDAGEEPVRLEDSLPAPRCHGDALAGRLVTRLRAA
jgi:hypothetical protein